ncbi:hypothetical protein EC973_002465 [Apophysomyces ossiformis]|uniref:Condensin complex subunit 2 n=1 Tax=Apophysomyces ossiformis TaxID=679940 RepID=A0A8H7BNJ8_9FUNG|nr:hypothetical protein EC973_002465 [Apophysomyces ossiformis]
MPVRPTLTPEQMYSNFEEWIKMCTDNKINATNTWNFALIDYFHEMTFLRDGDSINFQKASCTLDGCVKIYTSRVDSVASETGKLLSGLADGARESNSADSTEGDEVQREDSSERRSRRRGQRFETTLLKDFSSLSLKKFDLDFAVDPLFKKTSADFDEGGARGLLLNHLGIDQHCKIIFDASDANTDHIVDKAQERPATDNDNKHTRKQEDTSEKSNEDRPEKDTSLESDKETAMDIVIENGDEKIDGSEDENANDNGDENEDKNGEETVMVDQVGSKENRNNEEEVQEDIIEISRLKAKLPEIQLFSELRICPSLQDFDFFSDKSQNLPNLEDRDPPQDDVDIDAEKHDIVNANTVDDDAGDFFDYDDAEGPLLGGLDDDAFNDDGHGSDHGDTNVAEDVDPAGFEEGDFMMAFKDGNEKDLFSYFDSTLTKNWAGPEHWKLRRPVSKLKETENQENTEDGEKPKKKSKQTFEIEFINSEDVDEDGMFAATKLSKITMPIPKESTNKYSKHLLPDDMHFSSKQLLRFFLKPTFTIKSSKKSHDSEAAGKATVPVPDTTDYDFYDEPVDVQYWADQVPENTQEDPNVADTTANVTKADQTTFTAFDDTFYQDTYYDDGETSILYGDTLITNHRLKKVKPLYVNYARTAKRVDVKKLKDNLWKALTVPKQDTTSDTPIEVEPSDFVQGERRFTDLVQDIKKMYNAKAVKDISVPFCFICLLHLANEKNLTISSVQANGDDFVLGEGDWMQNEDFLNEITIVQNV